MAIYFINVKIITLKFLIHKGDKMGYIKEDFENIKR